MHWGLASPAARREYESTTGLSVEIPNSEDWMDDLLGDDLSDDSPGRSYRGFPTDPTDVI